MRKVSERTLRQNTFIPTRAAVTLELSEPVYESRHGLLKLRNYRLGQVQLH